jgi:hypothetical protein
MNKPSYLAALLVCQMFISVASAVAQNSGRHQPLELNNAVLPTPSKNTLLAPRIFSPEFYRKFKSRPWPYDSQEAICLPTNLGLHQPIGQFRVGLLLGQRVKRLFATNYILNAAALWEEPPADAGNEFGPESVRTKARP